MANNNCSSCFTINGHQKARRRVCRTKQVDYKSSDFSEPLVVGEHLYVIHYIVKNINILNLQLNHLQLLRQAKNIILVAEN